MKSKRKRNNRKQQVSLEADDTTCTECYAEFLDPLDLEMHIQQVHPQLEPKRPLGNLVHCQFCEKIFPDAETYVLHIRDVHLVDLRHCTYCSRVYNDLNLLKTHERKHTHSMSQDTHSCLECGRVFDNKYNLAEHEATHTCTDGGAFLNSYYALLSSVINMKADTVVQSIGKDFIFVCLCCKYSCPDLSDYIQHLKRENCRSLACDKCYKVFRRKRYLVDHLVRYQNCPSFVKTEVPPPKQCSKCEQLVDRREYKSHFQSCKVLKCPSCYALFENMYDLSEHRSMEHPLAVSLVPCKFCRKECVGKIALDKHIERTHEHEFHLYKYTCWYCDTSFKHPQRLFAHYFMKHREINPYLCKICDKTFRLRKPFTLHIKLVHKSVGFVEFDERLHVFFTEQKSAKPFQPVSKYVSKKPVSDVTPKPKDTSADKNEEVTESNENKNDDDDLQLVNVNSDFMNPTETEGNQTDVNESVKKNKRRRKTKLKSAIEDVRLTEDCDSDDEPLLVIKKKAKIKSQLRNRGLRYSKKTKNLKLNIKQRFTCEICMKYCYTFQNYHNHVSMHFKDESKKCIKCSLSFKAKSDLQRHLVEKHSSSKLTETLKKLLERRKTGEPKKEITNTEKFVKTIKKVVFDRDNVSATLALANSELSVRNFIENFKPDVNESKNIQVTNNITLTKVTGRVKREPVIKMNKFQPAPTPQVYGHVKLAMPVRFKNQPTNEKHSVIIRKVEPVPLESKIKYQYNDGNQFQDDYDNDNDYNYNNQDYNRDANIPEAEQEVTLEGTEEPPPKKLLTHKIILPKQYKEIKAIRIAHLLPEAPFYKIVKMDDIVQTPEKKDKPKTDRKPQPVQLPDGTKLVHVNPLAHLLGDTPVEKLIKPPSKYYKPKAKNFEDALAKALLKLENPKKRIRKKVEKVPPKAVDEEEKQIVPETVEEMVIDGEEPIENGNNSMPSIDDPGIVESAHVETDT